MLFYVRWGFFCKAFFFCWMFYLNPNYLEFRQLSLFKYLKSMRMRCRSFFLSSLDCVFADLRKLKTQDPTNGRPFELKSDLKELVAFFLIFFFVIAYDVQCTVWIEFSLEHLVVWMILRQFAVLRNRFCSFQF